MRRALALLATAGLATASVAWQSVNQLQQNGKTISTNLRVVDGTLMVPVKDVVGYLGGTLSVASGTATISGQGPSASPPPGMATPSGVTQPPMTPARRPDPKERTAKVGDVVDEDGLALTVLGVDRIEKGGYRTKLDPRGRRVSPALKGDRLVVVRMRLENTGGVTRRASVPSPTDVALFDEAGLGFSASAFDARPTGLMEASEEPSAYDPLESPLLAPKGAFEFAAVFSLPAGRTPRRVTVGLPPSSAESGGTNVRIDL